MALRVLVEYLDLSDHYGWVTDHRGTIRAVMHLASERPDWIPVLGAACQAARKAEAYNGEFAGSWVLSELQQSTGSAVWRPGLRTLAAYGLLEKAGPSTRGGRRAYYRMPDRPGVELGLQQVQQRTGMGAGH